MSTFNILNNKEMYVGQSGEENAMKTLLTEEASNAARCATEEITSGGITATAKVQRAHILSGTRELKQSNSVLTGHNTESNTMVGENDAIVVKEA